MKYLFIFLLLMNFILNIDGQILKGLGFEDFSTKLKKEMTCEEIKEIFGEPICDIRNAILVYIYTLTDSTEIVIGCTNNIRYAWHTDKDQKILNEIFSVPDKKVTRDYIKANIKREMNKNAIIDNFGLPDSDIGSGINIYLYSFSDSSTMIIGFTDRILYATYSGENGTEKLIE